MLHFDLTKKVPLTVQRIGNLYFVFDANSGKYIGKGYETYKEAEATI